MTAPTDKSIPPVRMVKQIPQDKTIKWALLINRFKTTRRDKKLGYITEPAMKSTRKIPMEANSGNELELILNLVFNLDTYLFHTQLAGPFFDPLGGHQDDEDHDDGFDNHNSFGRYTEGKDRRSQGLDKDRSDNGPA